LWRLIRHYWTQSSAARKFFWGFLAKALRKSPRLIPQTAMYMGMYMHFCKVHGDQLSWDPWRPLPRGAVAASDPAGTQAGHGMTAS
jgi:hypothetical protein